MFVQSFGNVSPFRNFTMVLFMAYWWHQNVPHGPAQLGTPTDQMMRCLAMLTCVARRKLMSRRPICKCNLFAKLWLLLHVPMSRLLWKILTPVSSGKLGRCSKFWQTRRWDIRQPLSIIVPLGANSKSEQKTCQQYSQFGCFCHISMHPSQACKSFAWNWEGQWEMAVHHEAW